METRPVFDYTPKINYHCVNTKKDVDPDNTVYYRDSDEEKVYCLDIEKLVDNFRKGNFINSYTGKKFSKSFFNCSSI